MTNQRKIALTIIAALVLSGWMSLEHYKQVNNFGPFFEALVENLVFLLLPSAALVEIISRSASK